jgi:hypothetical protein
VRVLISLRREAGDGVRVTLSIRGEDRSSVVHAAFPPGLVEAQGTFLRGATRGSQEDMLAQPRSPARGCRAGRAGEADVRGRPT